jgi:hypothetical protein
MGLHHVWTQELLSTVIADSLKLTLMNLVHMASVVILPDNTRTTWPHAHHLILVTLHNGEIQPLVVSD